MGELLGTEFWQLDEVLLSDKSLVGRGAHVQDADELQTALQPHSPQHFFHLSLLQVLVDDCDGEFGLVDDLELRPVVLEVLRHEVELLSCVLSLGQDFSVGVLVMTGVSFVDRQRVAAMVEKSVETGVRLL